MANINELFLTQSRVIAILQPLWQPLIVWGRMSLLFAISCCVHLCIAGNEALVGCIAVQGDYKAKAYWENIVEATDVTEHLEQVINLAGMLVVATWELYSDWKLGESRSRCLNILIVLYPDHFLLNCKERPLSFNRSYRMGIVICNLKLVLSQRDIRDGLLVLFDV